MVTNVENLPPLDRALAGVAIERITGQQACAAEDVLAVEEPLEIRVSFLQAGRRVHRPISVTMRTPGHDEELAVGFLFTEGLISGPDDVLRTHACRHGSVVRIHLREQVTIDLQRLERHFYTSSSCGVCGKTSIDAVRVRVQRRTTYHHPIFSAETIHQLPTALRAAQAVFEQTGGLHASALFDSQGNLLGLREDVGRHNALDKLIGAQLLSGASQLESSLLLVSGRVSFELVQKAAMAGIPIVAAVGAPSSLAIQLAAEHGLTVLGFVRQDRFNIYCGGQRIETCHPG